MLSATHKLSKFLFFVILLLMFVPTASGHDTSEYLNEFSNEGESCELVDIFEYHEQNELFGISYYSQMIPAFYQCCKGDKCVAIIVELNSKNLMKDDSFRELIDLNYIKHSLSTGNLTKTYFISKGLDLCYYHGADKLKDESLNLVADTAEQIASAKKTKTAKQVTEVIYFARRLELVSPFSVADFALSVTCNYNNDKIKNAVEKLAKCNLYLSHIQNNFAETGYVYGLDICMDEARYSLKQYIDDDFAKVKNFGDKTANILYAFYDSFMSLFEHPLKSSPNFKVEETDYEIASRLYNEMEGKKIYIHNPRIDIIFAEYIIRITAKRGAFNTQATNVRQRIYQVEKKVPDYITVTFTDIFYEPNYNISYAWDMMTISSENYDSCLKLFSEVKYNSAIACLEKSKVAIDNVENIANREVGISRYLDRRWQQLGFIALIIIIFIVGKLQKEQT